MSINNVLEKYLEGLHLLRLGGEEPAGLWITSLPLPRGVTQELNLNGQATFVKPVGQWYDVESISPRRLIMVADSGGKVPPELPLKRGEVKSKYPVPSEYSIQGVEMETFERAPAEDISVFYWERSMLNIKWRDKWVGIAMGLRTKGEVHWWEYCNIVKRSETENCVELEMGGAIPYELTGKEMFEKYKDKDNPYVHKHNWINGHIYGRIHSNGVCEIYAHHINSMFFDDGADLQDAVPVIGLCVEDEKDYSKYCGAWDGTKKGMELNGVAFDFSEVSRLATKEKPGRVDNEDGFLVLQPYLGAELHGGKLAEIRIGDSYFWRAEKKIFPRGMARTLRFSLSMNPDLSPRVARYVAPAWWYGMCEEFQPKPILPVSNEFDESINSARNSFHDQLIKGGFEDGLTGPRCEGDIPGAMFLVAYRNADLQTYEDSLRASYTFTDIYVDHAVKRTRFPGHHPGAVAIPLQRMQSALFAYLETGDIYCRNTAEAVINNAYWWHKNSWPRRAIGRDAKFVHSQMMLYRYLGGKHYLERTKDMVADILDSQWSNGTFGDQGGGAGIHGYAAYIIKPWMGCMATMGVVDYLELFPDDDDANRIVERFVEWLMKNRMTCEFKRGDSEQKNVFGWTYQYFFEGRELPGVNTPENKGETTRLVHLDAMARLLGWYSMKKNDSKYIEAYMEVCDSIGKHRGLDYSDGVSTLLYIPWLQDRLWNAVLTDRGLEVDPVYIGKTTPNSAKISTPDGIVELSWSGSGKVDAPNGMKCEIRDLTKRR